MLENKLKETRKKKGITQAKLSEATNISRETIAKIESGKAKTIRLTTATSIANALGVQATDIFLI